MQDLTMTNIELVPGRDIVRHLGLVQGSTVRSKHLGRDIMAGFKNLVGGELKGYTELLSDARDEATRRMAEEARSLGANAIVNIRYSTSSITAGASELYVYGTAVVVE
ncbi:MAG: YbjQ family protein [Hellea sp.]|nr:YbjQ family protein [Hellea sp.]